jgi:hypothetical protein
LNLRLLRRAQRRRLNSCAQNALQRAFIIDADQRAFNPAASAFPDHAFNRCAKLLLHKAVEFQLNPGSEEGPILTITSLDSSVPARASIIISIEVMFLVNGITSGGFRLFSGKAL